MVWKADEFRFRFVPLSCQRNAHTVEIVTSGILKKISHQRFLYYTIGKCGWEKKHLAILELRWLEHKASMAWQGHDRVLSTLYRYTREKMDDLSATERGRLNKSTDPTCWTAVCGCGGTMRLRQSIRNHSKAVRKRSHIVMKQQKAQWVFRLDFVAQSFEFVLIERNLQRKLRPIPTLSRATAQRNRIR